MQSTGDRHGGPSIFSAASISTAGRRSRVHLSCFIGGSSGKHVIIGTFIARTVVATNEYTHTWALQQARDNY